MIEDPHDRGEKPKEFFTKDFLWEEYGFNQKEAMIVTAFKNKRRNNQTVAFQAHGLLTQLEEQLGLV